MRRSKRIKTSHGEEGSSGRTIAPAVDSEESEPRTKKTTSINLAGRVEGLFATLPIEIFTQIIKYLYPGDLLAMARTGRSFRRFLLRRSVAPLWQQAECSLFDMGLPRCPPHMTEPKYAALLFAKTCTMCGAPTTRQADLYLLVRLCASCSTTHLMNISKLDGPISNLVPCSPSTGPQNNRSELKYYCLRDQAHSLEVQRAELEASGDTAAFEAWDYLQDQALDNRLKLGVKIYRFLRRWQHNEEELQVIQERRREIEKRATELKLGSQEGCKRIHYSIYVLWNTLTEQKKSLTPKAWKTLLPTVKLALLQSGEQNMDDQRMILRRICSARLKQLWLGVGVHPGLFAPMAAELGVRSMPSSSTVKNKMREVILTPFPNIKDGFKWDFMNVFHEHRESTPKTQALFISHLGQIRARIPEWVGQVERDLTGLLDQDPGMKHLKSSRTLTVKGTTTSAVHLPYTTRRLLRADCVFKATHEHPLFKRLHSGSDYVVPLPLFYPDLLITRRDEAWNPEWFEPHADASRVAATLLGCLGMRNVGHTELKVMGCRFACGKCSDQTATDWSGIIGHYLEEQRRYRFASMGTSSPSGMNCHRLADATIRVVPPEEAGEAPDLAELVPSSKPLHGGRKYHWTMDHGD